MSAQSPAVPAPLDHEKFPAIDTAIESFIGRQQMPGAVFWLERYEKKEGEGARYQKAFGKLDYDNRAAATNMDTIFDAASLTKVIATAPSIMLLIEQGKIAIDAPSIRYIPECNSHGKETVTIRHLLTHTSGLPAGIPAKLADGTAWHGEAVALKLACEVVTTHPPGTFFRYSDINFILLGQLVQRVSGMALNDFAAQKIFAPLGMKNTGYLPLKKWMRRVLRQRLLVNLAAWYTTPPQAEWTAWQAMQGCSPPRRTSPVTRECY